ncbi:hypothetical protein scyTo_0015351 [Scyliorhinus torazame]|uniref:Uncharacterized protein n=1 Tax=Scyliorhinus torazame TaxID=75743 RepID=A0A401PR54_SCYTO|nr:hypothetical protein [Scyliorhinus torazame]
MIKIAGYTTVVLQSHLKCDKVGGKAIRASKYSFLKKEMNNFADTICTWFMKYLLRNFLSNTFYLSSD